VARAARSLSPDLPVKERATRALKVIDRGAPPPSPTGVREVEINGGRGGKVRLEVVHPAELPLAPLMRRKEVPREDFIAQLAATCEVLGVWPQPPAVKSSPRRRAVAKKTQ
jgi:hypothetical protein